MSDRDQRPADRPVKSYLERYNDIKDMLHTNNTHGESSSSHNNHNNRQSHWRSGDDPVSSSMDDESTQTLERWESRKHRKMAEMGNSNPASALSNPPSSAGSNHRWVPRVDYRSKYASPEIQPKNTLPSARGDISDSSSPLFNDVELSPPQYHPHAHHFDNTKPSSSSSSYAEGLQSFSNAVSSSVAKEIAREYWGNPSVTFQRRDETLAAATIRENRPDPSEEHHNNNNDDGWCDNRDPDGEHYIGRRIKMNPVSSCCDRFSRRTEEEVWRDPDDSCFKPAWSEDTKRISRWHVIAAILVCVGCVIATAFTVKYVGRNDATAYYATGVTLRPTVSAAPSGPPSIPPSDMPSELPTNRPTSERDVLISEYLAKITDGVSDVEGSSQNQAKVWILHEDALALSLPSSVASDELIRAVKERIKQRYALATLYYAMGIGEGGVLKGWLEGDECRFVGDYDKAWDGVDCDEEGEVRALAIDGANLSGTIPRQISLLHKMQNLIIKNNPNLKGKIPDSIGNMSELRQIALYANSLGGNLPKSVFQLPTLVYLNVADNALVGGINWDGIAFQRNLARLILQNNFFDGSVPFKTLTGTKLTLLGLSNNNFRGYVDSSIGGMIELEYLYLDNNKFSGRLPDSLGDLTNLVSLNLDENEFDGMLPSTIGLLTKLKYLSAKGNNLVGGLPTDMKELSNLQTLNLADNLLSGSLRSLIAMPSLQHVHLYQNSFTGDIPSSLFTVPNLRTLFLSSNSLTGSIPAEVSSARKLKGLYLSDNMLQGSIPNAACSLTNLEDLFIDENAFSGTLPGCFGNLSKLKRLHAFKNGLSGNIPSSILNLSNLVELGLEENDISGGVNEVCEAKLDDSIGIDIWADCQELERGCECCTKCCSDKNNTLC